MTMTHTSPGRPTERQLRYLRILAVRTGTTFVAPRTGREASVEIERLVALLATRGRYADHPQGWFGREDSGMCALTNPHASGGAA